MDVRLSGSVAFECNQLAHTVLHLLQVQDWMLVLIVMCLVVVDVIIMAIYTGLEISMGGASKAVNRENEKTVSGVRCNDSS